MESATLLLLASGMGVMFGWQPMPDNSPRYEYIVQLEPELVATLEEGQAIPISSEIPDEIRPIGRIRITVGRNSPPRQMLTTTLKPLAETSAKKSLEGVIQTQYTVPPVERTGAGRYPGQPQTNQPILPPAGNPSLGNQGFAQTLQNTAQPVNDLATKVREILPPNGNNGFINTVQNTTQNVTNQVRNARESIRADAQQLFGNSGPLRQSLDQTGRQVHGAIQNASQQTQNAFDQLTGPLRNNRLTNTNQNSSNGATSNPAILPPQPHTIPRNTQPVANSQNNFNSGRLSTTQGNLQAPLLPPTSQPNENTNGRYANTPNTTGQNTQPANNTSTTQPNGTDWVTTPNFPAPQSTTATNNISATTSSPAAPEIRAGMLSQPPNAELQTANGQPVSSATSQTALASRTNNQTASSLGWDLPNANPQTLPANNANQSTNGSSTPLLLLSWVLLSGSGFGNAYLLWNYFDVRHKYRGMVHNTRNSTRRYSSLD